MARSKSKSDEALLALRAFGLAYPGAHTKSPWPGHMDLAVNDKTFAYMSLEGQPLSVGCKLPVSSSVAMMLPYAKPMGYGLGKSGWVTAMPPEGEIDVEMFQEWIDESYRAQAPKKLVAQLPPRGGASAAVAKKPTAAKPAAKKPAVKKPAVKKPVAKKPVAKKR